VGRLLLVRHGQARFLSADYDSLSPLGGQQATLLGDYWIKLGFRFDRIYSGTHKRQRDTADLVGDAYRRAHVPCPEPILVPGLEEFYGEQVVKKCLPELLLTNEEIRTRYQAFKAAGTEGERFRQFQRVFVLICEMWIHGELKAEGIETWTDFTQRVNAAISQITANSRGQHLAVFTSGGVIALALQRALTISTEHTLALAWKVRNTGWSEFLFSEGRFTLSLFNAVSHLDDTSMWTYR
jgi:broad specificity phosphatase PhoE